MRILGIDRVICLLEDQHQNKRKFPSVLFSIQMFPPSIEFLLLLTSIHSILTHFLNITENFTSFDYYDYLDNISILSPLSTTEDSLNLTLTTTASFTTTQVLIAPQSTRISMNITELSNVTDKLNTTQDDLTAPFVLSTVPTSKELTVPLLCIKGKSQSYLFPP